MSNGKNISEIKFLKGVDNGVHILGSICLKSEIAREAFECTYSLFIESYSSRGEICLGVVKELRKKLKESQFYDFCFRASEVIFDNL